MNYSHALPIFLAGLFINPFFVSAQNFKDHENIPEWENEAISALYQAEVIKGNDDGTIRPYNPINRAEFAKIIISATKKDTINSPFSNFLDIETSDWFSPYVEAAFRQNWLSGYPDGTFRPGQNINRAEVAKILSNAFLLDIPEATESDAWYKPYFRALNEKELLPYGVTIEDINPSTYPTRAEVFEQIYRLMREKGTISKPEVTPQTPEETTQNNIHLPPNPTSQSTTSSTTQNNQGIEDHTPQAQNPGKLYLSKNKLDKTTTSRGQSNIKIHSLVFSAKDNPVKISSISFRRVGNGGVEDFKNIVLKNASAEITSKITPSDDIFTLDLTSPVIIPAGQEITLDLYTDISKTAQTDTSSRFVLFLPDWISDDSKSKIGFFPFGGRDIVIK